MEVQVRKVRLKPLEGAYAEYLRITASYHQGGSYIADYHVERWLQIGQALGLPPPHTDNHASDGGGGPGERLKAQEEEENFRNWRAEHTAQLENVEIDNSSGSAKPREGTEVEKQEAEIRRAVHRKEVKERKKERHIEKAGCLADRGYAAYNAGVHGFRAKTEKCPHCGQKFVK